MSKRDHVPGSRPTLSAERPSRGQLTQCVAGSIKRKSTDTFELASEANKRTRGSSVLCGSNATSSSSISVPETIPETEHESTALPCTPVNKGFVEDSVTPTQNARLGSASTPPPPTTPVNATSQSSQVMPLILSSSNVDPACVNPSGSTSQTYQYPNARPNTPTRSQRSEAVSSNMTTRLGKPEMEDILRYELYGHVYKHRKFYEEFLVLDEAIQTEVRHRIVASGGLRPDLHLGFNGEDGRWTIHETIARQRDETAIYGVLADVLNVIGRAAYETYRRLHPGEQFRKCYHPFRNHSKLIAHWDSPSDAATSPDLVMGHDPAVMSPDEERAHWGDMELLIECKSFSEKGYRDKAYLQLARYARAVFAHQVYRLHVFGFSLCGSIVNFVCFDRSGLLHSTNINLSTSDGANLFVQHIITLLTISPDKFGYDTRYSFRRNDEQQLVETLFKFDNDYDPLVVSELLCHRKCCCGRATCVCALGEDLVHKSIWRPDDRDDEGVTLLLFEGVFGVCQVKASNCKKYSTKLQYPNELVWSDSASFFRPRKSTDTPAASASVGSKSNRLSASDVHRSDTAPVSGPMPRVPVSRGIRVKSDILMPRGVSLFDAQSSLHLVIAIHDALLGIMAFTEAGKIHCDISAYNLLLINPEKHYGKGGWNKSPKEHPNPNVWNITAKGTLHVPDDPVSTAEMGTSLSASHRLKSISKLKRGPVCVIHDTEFTVNEDKKRNKPHGGRTGTPAFISAQLLDGFLSEKGPANRTFMHDVESLLWILIWVVAHRSQDETEWKVNEIAQVVISGLSRNNLTNLHEYKDKQLRDRRRLADTIRGLRNDWSDDLAPIIEDLVEFVFLYLYFQPEPLRAVANLADLEEHGYDEYNLAGAVQKPRQESADEEFHRIYMTEPRIHTFVRLLLIFSKGIRVLESKCPSVDLTRV
ncbi:hypothetical protein FRC07_009625 [Ceratobasidium sp. 392]|nr:hypothetical protein FRC07_009625 [Ceratobasidium sp. 392]